MDFEGMQPTLRQVPPSAPRFSMHAVLRPSWAALMAAEWAIDGKDVSYVAANASLLLIDLY
jgi:hypothetical protein